MSGVSYLELLKVAAPETIVVLTVLVVLTADLVALRGLELRFRLLVSRPADSYCLLSGEHGLGLAFEIDVGGAADVDGDPLDGAAGEGVLRSVRVVGRDGLAAVPSDAQALTGEREHPGLGLNPAF